VGEHTIRAGETVLMLYPSANREPRKIKDAETFDVRREFTKGQFAFGYGRHFRLGARRARSEALVVFRELLRPLRLRPRRCTPTRRSRPARPRPRLVAARVFCRSDKPVALRHGEHRCVGAPMPAEARGPSARHIPDDLGAVRNVGVDPLSPAQGVRVGQR
jgi:hypothetical protein